MSILHRRIRTQHTAAADHAMGTYHPVAPHEMTMPVSIVYVTADGLATREAVPLWAGPRGQTVPADGPGHWAQLYAAGRP